MIVNVCKMNTYISSIHMSLCIGMMSLPGKWFI